MVKFYKLTRIASKSRIGFVLEDGKLLSNNYSLGLVVYKSDETFSNGKKRWFVVETSSGCALGQGESEQMAVTNFENNVGRMGIDSIKAAINRSIELYGLAPDYGVHTVGDLNHDN